MNMKERMEHAALRKKEMNCCQAVLVAFGGELGRSEEELLRLGSGFGSGMGTMEGTCGALAGAIMVSSLLSEMEADGIVSRKVYPIVPPKTEYALTDLGRTTVPIVHEMDKWGVDFFTRLGVPIPCDEE